MRTSNRRPCRCSAAVEAVGNILRKPHNVLRGKGHISNATSKSKGFDEPPAHYLTPTFPNNSLPHTPFAQGPQEPNRRLLHSLRGYTSSISWLRLVASVGRFGWFAWLAWNGSFGWLVPLKTPRRLQARLPFSPKKRCPQLSTLLLPTHPRPGGMREAIK